MVTASILEEVQIRSKRIIHKGWNVIHIPPGLRCKISFSISNGIPISIMYSTCTKPIIPTTIDIEIFKRIANTLELPKSTYVLNIYVINMNGCRDLPKEYCEKYLPYYSVALIAVSYETIDEIFFAVEDVEKINLNGIIDTPFFNMCAIRAHKEVIPLQNFRTVDVLRTYHIAGPNPFRKVTAAGDGTCLNKLLYIPEKTNNNLYKSSLNWLEIWSSIQQ